MLSENDSVKSIAGFVKVMTPSEADFKLNRCKTIVLAEVFGDNTGPQIKSFLLFSYFGTSR